MFLNMRVSCLQWKMCCI